MEYSLITRVSESSGNQEITPEELTGVISFGHGGGNGSMPRKDDTYEMKITVDVAMSTRLAFVSQTAIKKN